MTNIIKQLFQKLFIRDAHGTQQVDEPVTALLEILPAADAEENTGVDIEELQDSIRLAVGQGDWGKLEQIGRELFLVDPLPYTPIELLVYSLQQAGRLQAASEFAAQAIAVFPDSWMLNFIGGVSLNGVGQNEKACIYLRQALAIAPADHQTLRQLLATLAITEGLEQAAAAYAAHCQLSGKSADVAVAQISSIYTWASKVGLSLLDAGEVEQIPYKDPHIFGQMPAADVVTVSSNKPCVAELVNARLFSSSSIILTADGTAINDSGGDPQFGKYVDFAYEKVVVAQNGSRVLLDFSDFATREVPDGMYLSGLASDAYGHWLPEFLPKLQSLKQHPDFANLPIIVDADMPQSHFDHLKRLVDNPLILLRNNESLICRRLLFAPTYAFFPVKMFPNNIPMQEMPGLSPRAMRFVRGPQPDLTGIARHRRIFLSRKNMKWRRLINESVIAADLAELDFESICLEELAASEQIALFQEAAWIVAPNGSSLLNLIFADQSVKLLVLAQPDLFNWGTFQGPMDELGYESLCVGGDYALLENNKHSDYFIPVERIREALGSMGMIMMPIQG